MRVKVCGITNREDAFKAVDYGADALGFIIYPKSKRFIEPVVAWEIARELPPFVQRWLVSVNRTVADHKEIADSFGFDVFQMHGDETPEVCSSVNPSRASVVKVFGLPDDSVDASSYQDCVSGFLLDKASPARGGTGETFDWKLACKFISQVNKPVVLSGGLNPDNVVEAIETVKPFGIDVCSGVESRPGQKDLSKMKSFIEQAKSQSGAGLRGFKQTLLVD